MKVDLTWLVRPEGDVWLSYESVLRLLEECDVAPHVLDQIRAFRQEKATP